MILQSFSIITQVIIEILQISLVEDCVMSCYNHLAQGNLVLISVLRLFGQQLVDRRDSGGPGILLPQDFCDKTMQAVMRQPIKKI